MNEPKKLYETITAENWIKGKKYSGSRACLVGHWDRRYADLESLTLARVVSDSIDVMFPERLSGVHGNSWQDFNDHPDTAVEDVIRVCKVADV